MRLRGADGVVDSPEAISPAFLTRVLSESGSLAGGVVSSVLVEPVGTGQMADTLRLHLEVEGPSAAPETLVAKIASSDEASRATGAIMRAYEVEVCFYAEVAERTAMRAPEAHWCALDVEAGAFTLILSDVVGATQGDQIAGCSVDVAAACLEDLAGLHGPCWEDPALAALGWLNRGGPELEGFTAGVVQGVLPAFLERYGSMLSSDQVGLLEAFIPRMGDWYAARVGPRTAAHSDFRLDNLLFVPGESRPVVVDFQTMVWGHAGDDLAYLIGGNLLPEDRRGAEEDLIAEYLGLLAASGVEGYGRAEIDRAYRLGTLAGVVMGVGASMLVQRTERGDEMFLCSIGRHAQHALDLDALSLL